MARINNRNKYPQNDPVSINDYLIGTDAETGFTKTFSVASLLGLGGDTPPVGDTAASLSGNIITFPDGQTVVIPVDTDTDTFATINSGIITFANGDVVDLGAIGTDTFATINNDLLTLADGTTYDLTDDSATLAGNVITFPTGQTITIPNSSTDDQVASEVPVQTNNFNGNLQVTDDTLQKVADRLDDLTLGSNDNYTIDIVGSTINLSNNGIIVSSDTLSSIVSTVSNTISGHTIATHTNGSGVQTDIAETVTTLNINANVLEYTREDGNVDTVDLNLYLDDTNLARITSGTLDNNTGIATFTRDDNTTFTLDLSGLLGGAMVSASNGTEIDGTSGDVILGGALDKNTNIDSGSFSFAIGNNSNVAINSFIIGGTNNTATGINNGIVGGFGNQISGGSQDQGSHFIGAGINNTIGTFARYAGILGGEDNEVITGFGVTAMGRGHRVFDQFSTTVGQYSLQHSGVGNTSSGNNSNFSVGNGGGSTSRSNAFTVKHSGLVTADSLTTALIDNEATGKVLTTREWVQAEISGASTPSERFIFGLTGAPTGVTAAARITKKGNFVSIRLSILGSVTTGSGATGVGTTGFILGNLTLAELIPNLESGHDYSLILNPLGTTPSQNFRAALNGTGDITVITLSNNTTYNLNHEGILTYTID